MQRSSSCSSLKRWKKRQQQQPNDMQVLFLLPRLHAEDILLKPSVKKSIWKKEITQSRLQKYPHLHWLLSQASCGVEVLLPEGGGRRRRGAPPIYTSRSSLIQQCKGGKKHTEKYGLKLLLQVIFFFHLRHLVLVSTNVSALTICRRRNAQKCGTRWVRSAYCGIVTLPHFAT